MVHTKYESSRIDIGQDSVPPDFWYCIRGGGTTLDHTRLTETNRNV